MDLQKLAPELLPILSFDAFSDRKSIKTAVTNRFRLLDEEEDASGYAEAYAAQAILEIHRTGHKAIAFEGASAIESFANHHLNHCRNEKRHGAHVLENWRWVTQAPDATKVLVGVRYWSYAEEGDDRGWELKVEGNLELDMVKIQGTWLTSKQISYLSTLRS